MQTKMPVRQVIPAGRAQILLQLQRQLSSELRSGPPPFPAAPSVSVVDRAAVAGFGSAAAAPRERVVRYIKEAPTEQIRRSLGNTFVVPGLRPMGTKLRVSGSIEASDQDRCNRGVFHRQSQRASSPSVRRRTSDIDRGGRRSRESSHDIDDLVEGGAAFVVQA
jgi:hypothetical protein